MKKLTVFLLAAVLAGCRSSRELQADIYDEARAAEVIVYASVRRELGKERLFAQDVLKGSLGNELRFRVGDEILPGFSGELSSRNHSNPVDGVLLFYRTQFGALSYSGMWSMKNGRILSLEGEEGILSTFTSRLKDPANKAPEPTPGAVTPRATEGTSK